MSNIQTFLEHKRQSKNRHRRSEGPAMGNLEGALELAGKGIYVLPLCWPDDKGKCACYMNHTHPKEIGKAPLISGGYKNASSDEHQIREWWTKWPDANVGIALQQSGFYDISSDSSEWYERFQELGIPDGAASYRSSEDYKVHFLMRRPDGCPTTRSCKSGERDLMADGYAVAPPSLHKSGRNYEWVVPLADVESLPEAPKWAVDMLTPSEEPKPKRELVRNLESDGTPPIPLTKDWMRDLWEGKEVRWTPEGEINRSETLYHIGKALVKAGLRDEAEIAEALAERDESLGFDKYASRKDGGDKEYYRIAVKVLDRYADDSADEEDEEEDEKQGAQGAGPTEKLANAITSSGYFATDAGRKLYVYQNGVYRPHGEEHVKTRVRALLEAAGQKWTSHRAKEVLEYITVGANTLLDKPTALNLKNGVIQLISDRPAFFQHSPYYLTQVQLPVVYDPEAECPEFDKFVSEVFPPDAVEAGVPYEIFAWLMEPGAAMQKALLLYSDGESGKSSYLSVLRAFLGEPQNVSALSLHHIVSERFSVAGLVGKLANICPDIPSKHLSDVSVFKTITDGKEALKGEYKFKDPFDFVPFARLAFSANKIPTCDDDSHGYVRRWLIVPFPNQIPEEKQIQRETLAAMLTTEQELSGILNKALMVCPRVRERGVTETPSMRKAWEQMQRYINPMEEWLSERTIESPMERVRGDKLYANYQEFCQEVGMTPLPRRDHTRRLEQMRPKLIRTKKSTGGYPFWRGIGLIGNTEAL